MGEEKGGNKREGELNQKNRKLEKKRATKKEGEFQKI
jgi:hypothetical protein